MRRYVFAALAIFAAAIVIMGPAHAALAEQYEADVAILDSGYTRHYAALNSWDYAEDFIDASWLTVALARAGISAAVISDHDIEMGLLPGYKVLVLPSASCMSPLGAEMVRRFAEGGGRVFSTYDTSLRDDYWRARPDYELSDVMGVRYAGTAPGSGSDIIPAAKSHPIFRGIGDSIPVALVKGLNNKVNADAIVLARWSDGRPAIVENAYGVYVSENTFSHKNLSAPEVAALIQNTVRYLVDDKYGAPFNLGRLDTRAAWYRPASTPDGIAKDLQKLADAHFNTVFVESFYHGYTIYPGAVARQKPEYAGWDPLAVAIAEGRRLGLQVHAWIETFYVGPGIGDGLPGPILEQHPDWAAIGLNGRIQVEAEANKSFLSPAHPEVQKFIISLIEELATRYKLDGIHFDYLRYPNGRTVPYDYNPAVLSLAQASLGFNPRNVGIDMAKWNAWYLWRSSNLTDFVAVISSTVRRCSPGTKVSAAVYPYPDAVLTRMQDWRDWSARGLVDFLVVFTYTRDQDLLDTMIRTAQAFAGDRTPVIAAVDAASMTKQQAVTSVPLLVEVSRAAGANGVAIFTLNALGDEVLSALGESQFKPSQTH